MSLKDLGIKQLIQLNDYYYYLFFLNKNYGKCKMFENIEKIEKTKTLSTYSVV